MNTQKYSMGNCGLFAEADRTMYEDKATGKYKDTVSKSIIDFSKTHLNYNLCPHAPYKPWEVKAINERIRGKRMPKNAVAWGSTLISLPKDYNGDPRQFFEVAYEGMKKMYNLTDNDVISAYVHYDESGAKHMHFYFIPIVHERERDRVSWDKVMPRKMYKKQHEVLQKYMTEKLHTTVNLLNGETLGIDIQHMDAQQRKASMMIMETEKQIEAKKEEIETLDIFKAEKQATIATLDAQITKKQKMWENIAEKILQPYIAAVERLVATFDRLKPKEKTKEQDDVYSILEKSNQVFGRGNPKEISKATKTMNKKSVDLEATYLTIEEDDDWER